VNFLDDFDLGTLSEHFVTTTEMRPLLPTAPAIFVSCDLKRSYVEAFGVAALRKLPSVIRHNIFDYVVAATRLGKISLRGLIETVAATTGVATVKQVLIDGKSQDALVPCKAATPKSIDVAVLQIRNDL
jgi:hypothetical protein